MFDVEAIRSQFPALSLEVNGHPLTYLDNGASAQKPQRVIDRISKAYSFEYANVHRGLHHLSNVATENFEQARKKVQTFIGAEKEEEIIFTKSATEAFNLVAHSLIAPEIQPGDEIIISLMEHHSNIVPWHYLKERYGAVIRWIPVLDDGTLDMLAFENLLNEKTKLVAVTHMSNVLGTINPINEICEKAHSVGAYVVVDGAQAAVHEKIDMTWQECDFYVMTGHKLYGPSGIGVLYGRHDILSQMRPFLGGGEMIKSVTTEHIEYADLPHRFEAGTPPIVQAIALGEALDFLTEIDMGAIKIHEKELLNYANSQMAALDKVRIIGNCPSKGSIITFSVKDIHAHDISAILDKYGVAVRAGTHCAEPLLTHFGETSTCRASMGMYNTKEDIDRFIEALSKAIQFFS